MKLKKIVSIITLTAICVSLFSGCYSATESTPSSMWEMSSYETGSVASTVPAAKYSVTLSKTFTNWSVSQNDAYVFMMSSNTTSIMIMKAADLTNATWDEALPLMKSTIEGVYTNIIYTDEAVAAKVAGYDAKKSTFTGDQKGLFTGKSDENTFFTNTFYSVIIGNELYIIELNCQTARYADMKSTMDDIVNAMQFTQVA